MNQEQIDPIPLRILLFIKYLINKNPLISFDSGQSSISKKVLRIHFLKFSSFRNLNFNNIEVIKMK